MKISPIETRDMRTELAVQGNPKETYEIRKSISTDGMKFIVTLQPPYETQRSHKHLLTKETTHLFEGGMQVYSEFGGWSDLKKDEVADFELNEYHNARTNGIISPVSYSGADGRKIAALHLTTKYMPSYVHLEKDEAIFLFKYDWFGEEQRDNPTDPKASPLLRADRDIQKKFWKILERNKSRLEYDIEKVEYVTANRIV